MEGTGSVIRAWREEKGLSRREMAVLLGVNYFTLYRWERDMNTPSPMAVELLKKLMKNGGTNDGKK